MWRVGCFGLFDIEQRTGGSPSYILTSSSVSSTSLHPVQMAGWLLWPLLFLSAWQSDFIRFMAFRVVAESANEVAAWACFKKAPSAAQTRYGAYSITQPCQMKTTVHSTAIQQQDVPDGLEGSGALNSLQDLVDDS